MEKVYTIERVVEIKFEDGNLISFEDCWLRDHCRCSTCYHADTYQRSQHILDIPDARVKSFSFSKTQLNIIWDCGHNSLYSAEFLLQFDYKKWSDKRRLRPQLWRGTEVTDKVARLNVKQFLSSAEGAKPVFQSLLDYGVAFIEDVSPNLMGTEEVCQALGGVQRTVFGGMWQFTTKPDHADTAYTNLPLAVHNDNTYFTEAAGLQILHCIEHTGGSGGKTVLVDGFYGATELRKNCPEDYEFLTTFDVEAEYIEEGHHHSYSAPIIRINRSTQELTQIRYNVYDRSAMAFADGGLCRSYYRSLRNLARYYQDPANQWQFKLKPGTVMVIDNFRVLHGRTSFTGTRVLCGSYVTRSDWLDRARTLKLIG
ncbi:hypothetical protein ACJJTC_011155 [Scirpophaga incertulas]